MVHQGRRTHPTERAGIRTAQHTRRRKATRAEPSRAVQPALAAPPSYPHHSTSGANKTTSCSMRTHAALPTPTLPPTPFRLHTGKSGKLPSTPPVAEQHHRPIIAGKPGQEHAEEGAAGERHQRASREQAQKTRKTHHGKPARRSESPPGMQSECASRSPSCGRKARGQSGHWIRKNRRHPHHPLPHVAVEGTAGRGSTPRPLEAVQVQAREPGQAQEPGQEQELPQRLLVREPPHQAREPGPEEACAG